MEASGPVAVSVPFRSRRGRRWCVVAWSHWTIFATTSSHVWISSAIGAVARAPVQVRIRQQLHSHVVRMGWFRRQMRWEVLQCPGLQEVCDLRMAYSRSVGYSDGLCGLGGPTATAGSHQEEERACRLEDHTLNHPEAVVLEKVCRAGVDSRVDRNERHNEDHPVFGEGHKSS